MRPDLVAGFDDGVTEIVEQLALSLIGLHRGLDLIDRPAGNLASFLIAALDYALLEPRHTLWGARSLHVVVIAVGEEDGLVDVAIAVGPERIVPPVIPGPQREVKEVAIGIGPEPGADPADMEEVVVVPPFLVPALVPERVECRLVGEVSPRAKVLRVGCVLQRRGMRVQSRFVVGGIGVVVMAQIAVVQSIGVGVNPGRVRVAIVRGIMVAAAMAEIGSNASAASRSCARPLVIKP